MKRRKRTTKTLKDLLQQIKRELRQRQIRKRKIKFYQAGAMTAKQRSIGFVVFAFFLGYLSFLLLDKIENYGKKEVKN